jgi:hypothetical protein
MTLQSLGFHTKTVLTPCLILAPFGLVILFLKWQILDPGPSLSVLLVLHGLVVPGFWIGVTFLDRYSDASLLIQDLINNPLVILCGTQYQSVLIDHGAYNTFLCCHILKNFSSVLCFGYKARIYFTLLCFIYFLLLFFSYLIRSHSSGKLRQQLSKHPALGTFLNPRFKTTTKRLCNSCESHTPQQQQKQETTTTAAREILKQIQEIESEWEPLLEARKSILEFYHSPKCETELDVARVTELLSRAVDLKSIKSFLTPFQVSHIGTLLTFILEVTKTPKTLLRWIECYEYLSITFPYDVLYPYSNPHLLTLGWKWNQALIIAGLIYLLGVLWFVVLSFFFPENKL